MAVTSSRSGEARFLDPTVIARIASLELKARTIVEGFLSEVSQFRRVALLGEGASGAETHGWAGVSEHVPQLRDGLLRPVDF